MAMFHVMDMFLYQGHVSISMFIYQVFVYVLSWYFMLKGCFNWSFLVYIKVYYLFWGLCVSMSLRFINSIHSKDIHPKIKLFFCKFPCFMSSMFNICHIFILSTFSMFYILGLFLRFFCFFSCKLVERHLRWSTFKWKC